MKKWTAPFALLLLAACGSGESGESGDDGQCDFQTPCPTGFECNLLTSVCEPAGDAGGGDADAGTDADGGTDTDAGGPDTDGGSGDPCDGVSCDDPPANECDGDTAIMFPATGTCSDGTCGYEEARTNCADSDQVCMNGACVDPADPCAAFPCNTPPGAACEGDVVQRYTVPGECSLDVDGMPTCSYTVETLDCEEFGNQCLDGACVTPDLCRDVDCSAVPPAECRNDETVVVYSGGACDEGECLYNEALTDCTLDGTVDEVCQDGACIARPDCFGITCDEPPLDACDGDTLVAYDDAGTCSADTCSYDDTRIDCTATGQICQAGECVLPTACDGELCAAPPAPLCRGDIAVSFSNPGVCVEGICQYDEIENDCAAADGYCEGGVCEFFEECLDLDCSVVPEPTCDDITTVVTYSVPSGGPVCRDAACVFDESTSECDDGFVCDGGECIEFDPCTGVVCDRAAFCEGDIAVTDDANGTCDEGACDYSRVERRVDCSLSGLSCLDGTCVEPAGFLNPGDLVFTEYATIDSATVYSYLELTSTSDRGVDISGLRVRVNDDEVVLPSGTILPAYGSVVISSRTEGPESTVPVSFTSSFGTTFTATATGSIEIDRIEVTDAWPHVDDGSTQLDFAALFVGNDDVSDWCFTNDPLLGLETPGQLPHPCGSLSRPPEVSVTEIMATGEFAAGEEEWIEFFNAGSAIDLGGARLGVGSDVVTVAPGTTFGAESYLVLAPSRFMAANGATAWIGEASVNEEDGTADLFYGTLQLTSLEWSTSNGWPFLEELTSLQLGVSPFDGDYEEPGQWCFATAGDTYDDNGNLGTPGAASSCSVD